MTHSRIIQFLLISIRFFLCFLILSSAKIASEYSKSYFLISDPKKIFLKPIFFAITIRVSEMEVLISAGTS